MVTTPCISSTDEIVGIRQANEEWGCSTIQGTFKREAVRKMRERFAHNWLQVRILVDLSPPAAIALRPKISPDGRNVEALAILTVLLGGLTNKKSMLPLCKSCIMAATVLRLSSVAYGHSGQLQR